MDAPPKIPPEPALVQYWHSEEIPEEIETLLASFRERNPDLPQLVFSERSGAAFLAERYGERELAAFRACAVPAMQADYLRYCVLAETGGVYADVDFRCVEPLRPLLERRAGTLFGMTDLPGPFRTPAYEWRERLGPFRAVQNNLFAAGPAGRPLMRLAMEIATLCVERRIAENVALTTGPGVFTSLYFLRELGSLGAYREYVRDGAFEPMADPVCEAVGEYGRVEEAFKGVEIRPIEAINQWLRLPQPRPAYKDSGAHWLNFRGSIFR